MQEEKNHKMMAMTHDNNNNEKLHEKPKAGRLVELLLKGKGKAVRVCICVKLCEARGRGRRCRRL